MSSIHDDVRQILVSHGQMSVRLPLIGDDDDLYQNGLSSHASVNVMLALENNFNIEFPDSMLRKSTFQSVATICEAIRSLGIEPRQN